jgi:hypothetical protein
MPAPRGLDSGSGRNMPRPGMFGSSPSPGHSTSRGRGSHHHPIADQTRTSVNQQWTLNLGAASAGTFTLNPGGLGSTAGIAFNAAFGAVQSALELIVGVGNVTVTGGPLPGTVTITFTGVLAGEPTTLTGNFAGLTGATPVLTNTVAGNNIAGVPGGVPPIPGPR